MSRLADADLNQDLIFTGPVTQEELILTWKKRRQERLDRERAKAEARKLEEANMNGTADKMEELKGETDRIEVNGISEPAPITPLPEEETESVQLPPKSAGNILRPARLNIDPSSFTTDWAKRINMTNLGKPKRPEYVQPLESDI